MVLDTDEQSCALIFNANKMNMKAAKFFSNEKFKVENLFRLTC